MKKIVYRFVFVLQFAIIAGICGSCSKDVSYEYLRLSLNSYTFSADGYDTCRIGVESNVEWTVGEIPEWIDIVETGQDYLLLTASANDLGQDRECLIAINGGDECEEFSACQMHVFFDDRMIPLYDLNMPVISRNGKYMAGVRIEYTPENPDLPLARLVVRDLVTGEVTEREDLYEEYDCINAISDDGRTVVFYNFATLACGIMKDGSFSELILPDNYYFPVVSNMSADGSVMVGWCNSKTERGYFPVKWINGEPEILERPEKNLSGKPLGNGAMARGCSADGSVVYGSEWDTYGLVYWKDGKMYHAFENNIEHNPKDPAMDEYSGVIVYSDRFKISNNGDYIAASYRPLGNMPLISSGHPCMVDTRTGNIAIIESIDGRSVAVGNDGLFFGGSTFSNMSNGHVSFFGEEPVSLSQWMADKGICMLDNNQVLQISDDGNVFLGATYKVTMLGVVYQYWVLVLD